MLRRLEVFFIASMFIVITAIILVIYTMEREQEFKSYNRDIQTTIVKNTAYVINQQLDNKRQHVRLFLDEYSRLFSHLIKYPDDEVNSENISRRLGQRFKDFYTYTIADNDGNPTLLDIDSLVGEACQADLNHFASRVNHQNKIVDNEVFVHPQPYHYHYDIMAPLVIDGNNESRYAGIFFSSFYLDEIADILKTHELPGQQLFLVRQSNPKLIEVSNQGARDKLSRDSKLSDTELRKILVFENIPETDWRLVVLSDADFERQYIKSLWQEVIVILFVVSIAIFILIVVMFRFSGSRGDD